jgi:hypothetical protein
VGLHPDALLARALPARGLAGAVWPRIRLTHVLLCRSFRMAVPAFELAVSQAIFHSSKGLKQSKASVRHVHARDFGL